MVLRGVSGLIVDERYEKASNKTTYISKNPVVTVALQG